MKKITKLIITLSLIFSSLSTTFAKEWYIESLLNLNYSVEEYKLDLVKIDYINFNNKKHKQVYNKLKTSNDILKKWFIKNYKDWKYKSYQINWIIKNYNNFVYHTNKLFLFLKIKEQNNNYTELNTAILRSYINMKTSFTRVQNIIKRK